MFFIKDNVEHISQAIPELALIQTESKMCTQYISMEAQLNFHRISLKALALLSSHRYECRSAVRILLLV